MTPNHLVPVQFRVFPPKMIIMVYLAIDDFYMEIRKSHAGNPHFFMKVTPQYDDVMIEPKTINLRFDMKNLRKLYNELTIYFAERDLLLPRHIPEVII